MFLGHGSPMNAIEENEFVRGWREIGSKIGQVNAIVCISAHWETKGTLVTAMEKPKTIHDFGGFPQELFEVNYPAPGDPELAENIHKEFHEVGKDYSWGLDHGCWSVLKHICPNADIPVLQLSLDRNLSPDQHYDLAKKLSVLRKRGVLMIGSGNMVHNLGMINWIDPLSAYDWAIESNETLKTLISKGDDRSLRHYSDLGKAVNLAVPTPEHFLPLLYIQAMKSSGEEPRFFNDKTVMGSISMTSTVFGLN